MMRAHKFRSAIRRTQRDRENRVPVDAAIDNRGQFLFLVGYRRQRFVEKLLVDTLVGDLLVKLSLEFAQVMARYLLLI